MGSVLFLFLSFFQSVDANVKFNTCSQRKVSLEYSPERIEVWNVYLAMFGKGVISPNVMCFHLEYILVKYPQCNREAVN